MKSKKERTFRRNIPTGKKPYLFLFLFLFCFAIIAKLYLVRDSLGGKSVADLNRALDKWETFQSDDSGFSFQYPKSWKITENCAGGSEGSSIVCLESPDLEENAVPVVVKGARLQFFDSPEDGLNLTQSSSIFCKEDEIYGNVHCQEKQINNYSVMQRTIGPSITDYGIQRNGKFAVIIREEVIDTNSSSYELRTLLDRILGTVSLDRLSGE